jgi:hypothetical protein
VVFRAAGGAAFTAFRSAAQNARREMWRQAFVYVAAVHMVTNSGGYRRSPSRSLRASDGKGLFDFVKHALEKLPRFRSARREGWNVTGAGGSRAVNGEAFFRKRMHLPTACGANKFVARCLVRVALFMMPVLSGNYVTVKVCATNQSGARS